MSRPCIIRNAIPTPPSLQRECKQQGKVLEKQKNHPLRLTLDDLVELAAQDGDEEMILTVDSTPDGHGDCVRTVWPNDNQRNQRIEVKNTRKLKKMFVKPEEKKMSLTTFRKLLRKGRFHYREKRSNNFEGDTCIKGGLQIFPEGLETAELSNGKDTADHAVLYYSRQNDCLRTELKALFDLNLFPSSFDFAEEAFDTGSPDAINLWIGDERSVSSMHKDHYENLFYILSGEKVFTVCPPADSPFLHEKEFESGTFCQKGCENTPQWIVEADVKRDETTSTSVASKETAQTVRWIEPDLENVMPQHDLAQTEACSSYLEQYPMLKFAHPQKVILSEGDMLYLPSLWYHQVTQTCETVAVNYWFDMKFESPLWSYFNFIQNLNCRKVE